MGDGGVVRRPAVPPPVRIRRNINDLDLTDDIVVFYSKAIGKMKEISIKEPQSWRYQGAIHDYPFPADTFDQRRRSNPDENTTDEDSNRDPLARADDQLPSDRDTFWRQCQHATWFFLPWHRIYLHHFEKIVMDQVALLPGGPKDWALPYWKWDAKDGEGRIPIAFRSPFLADGKTVNHLFVKERNQAPGRDANKGERIASDTAMDKAFLCLKPSVYMGNGQFGGPPVFRHAGQGPPETVPPALRGAGLLEGTPHGTMHTSTGGNGWMSSFTQAALDPIFWLHHCNIDRLWEVWIQRDPVNRNPDDTAWLDRVFKFRDAKGGNGDMSPRQVLNTRRAPLSYEYDDATDPLKKP